LVAGAGRAVRGGTCDAEFRRGAFLAGPTWARRSAISAFTSGRKPASSTAAFNSRLLAPGWARNHRRANRAAGLRWPVEEGFEFGKDCFGLDQSQVRLYTAIARHTVLVCAALAVCAVTAALLRDRTDSQVPEPTHPDQSPPVDPGLIPLTIPEIKHLIAEATATPRPPGHATHWVNWRREHQARSRWLHKRTRLARNIENTQVS
jgi:hypothetical protein